MKIILTGPPGTGKSEQATLIANRYKIKHISAGNLLREEIKQGTQIGKKVEKAVSDGDMAPDELVDEIVAKTIEKTEGFVLDGYPRDLNQAKICDDFKIMIEIDTTEEEIIKRLEKRKRSDDDINIVRHRFKVYKELTEPVLEYYSGTKKVEKVDGNGTIQEVSKRIEKVLDNL